MSCVLLGFRRHCEGTNHINAHACVQVLQNFWLSVWSERTAAWEQRVDAGADEAFPSGRYMMIYFGMGVTSVSFSLMRAITLVLATLHASQTLCAPHFGSHYSAPCKT
jgi:hypothetical protein